MHLAQVNLPGLTRGDPGRADMTERLRQQPALEHVEPAGLAQALAGLPAADRELLLLTVWEGLAPAEIARVLNRPVALISRRLYRARQRLASRATATAGEVFDALPTAAGRVSGRRVAEAGAARGHRRRRAGPARTRRDAITEYLSLGEPQSIERP